MLFTALPVAGLRLAGELRADPRWRNQAPRVRRWSVAAGLTAVAFVICQLLRLMPGLPGAGQLAGICAQGLAERAAVLTEAALLLGLTRVIRQLDASVSRHGAAGSPTAIRSSRLM